MRRTPTELDKYSLSLIALEGVERQCCSCNYYISHEDVWSFRAKVTSPNQERFICRVCAPESLGACKIAKSHGA